jgi:hypothetical protein
MNKKWRLYPVLSLLILVSLLLPACSTAQTTAIPSSILRGGDVPQEMVLIDYLKVHSPVDPHLDDWITLIK